VRSRISAISVSESSTVTFMVFTSERLTPRTAGGPGCLLPLLLSPVNRAPQAQPLEWVGGQGSADAQLPHKQMILDRFTVGRWPVRRLPGVSGRSCRGAPAPPLQRLLLPLRHKALLPRTAGRPIVSPLTPGGSRAWTTPHLSSLQECTDDPAPAPTLSTDHGCCQAKSTHSCARPPWARPLGQNHG
jgi:hypothetical protein